VALATEGHACLFVLSTSRPPNLLHHGQRSHSTRPTPPPSSRPSRRSPHPPPRPSPQEKEKGLHTNKRRHVFELAPFYLLTRRTSLKHTFQAVQWAEDTVDNEFLGRKSSKRKRRRRWERLLRQEVVFSLSLQAARRGLKSSHLHLSPPSSSLPQKNRVLHLPPDPPLWRVVGRGGWGRVPGLRAARE